MCSPTEPDIKGPFYISGAPHRTVLAGPEEPGERIVIRGRAFAADCQTPLTGALLDVWQADANGHYHDENENYRLRGQMNTNDQGVYEFSSIRPGRYTLEGGFRPAHIHFTVRHPDCEPLTTQLYFKGDPYLAPNDACGDACKSNDTNRIIELTRTGKDGRRAWFEGRFDIVLKPAGSTR
ncbi:MAG: twin-arginine translocation pathway signal protein [Gammaproteobacteria bacterium]